MKRLLAAAVAAVLSVPLLAVPPAAAAQVQPNLVANGTFSPTFGLAPTGWECGPGTNIHVPPPGAEFVQLLPVKDKFVPPTVVPKPVPAEPSASVSATPTAGSPKPGVPPTTPPGAEFIQRVRATARPAGIAPALTPAPSASAAPAAGDESSSGTESALNRSPLRELNARLTGQPSTFWRAECAQVVPVRANSTYTLTARVNGGWVFLGSDYGMTYTHPAPQDVTLTHTFVTGPTTDRVRIYLHGWFDGGMYFADDVVLTGPSSDSRVPEAPRQVSTAEQTSGSAVVYWAASPGATSYEVLRDGEPVATTINPWAVLTGLTPGQKHVFAVRARNAAGKSEPSAGFAPVPVPAYDEPPSAPSINVAFMSSGGVGLALVASRATDGYLVYVDGVLAGWSYTWRAMVPMSPGTHTVDVTAFNSAGESARSSRTITVPAG
jgi:hypothetical protein